VFFKSLSHMSQPPYSSRIVRNSAYVPPRPSPGRDPSGGPGKGIFAHALSRRAVFRILAEEAVDKKNRTAVFSVESGACFLRWAGALQQAYEQLRATALAVGETEFFQQCGMSLLVFGQGASAVRLFTVSRVRAPVRAGQFMLEQLLSELRIVGHQHGSVQAGQMKEASI